MKKSILFTLFLGLVLTLTACGNPGESIESLDFIGSYNGFEETDAATDRSIRSYVQLDNGDFIIYGSQMTYIDVSEKSKEILDMNYMEFVGQLETSKNAIFKQGDILFIFSDSKQATDINMPAFGNGGMHEEFMFTQYEATVHGDHIYMTEMVEHMNDNGDGTGYSTFDYKTTVFDESGNVETVFEDTYLLHSIGSELSESRLFAFTKEENGGTAYKVDGVTLTSLHTTDIDLYYTINVDGTDVLVFMTEGNYVTVFIQEDGTKTELQGVEVEYNNKLTVFQDSTPQDNMKRLYDKTGQVVLETDAYGVITYLGEDRYIDTTHSNHELFNEEGTVLSSMTTASRFNYQLNNLFIDQFGEFTIGRTTVIFFAMLGDEFINGYQFIGMDQDFSSIYYYMEEESGDLYIKRHTETGGPEDYSPPVVDDYFERFNADEEFLDRELYIGFDGVFIESRVENNKIMIDLYNEAGTLLAGGHLLGHRYLENETSQYLIYTTDGELVTVDFFDFSFYVSL